jgi:hypothetical protein
MDQISNIFWGFMGPFVIFLRVWRLNKYFGLIFVEFELSLVLLKHLFIYFCFKITKNDLMIILVILTLLLMFLILFFSVVKF